MALRIAGTKRRRRNSSRRNLLASRALPSRLAGSSWRRGLQQWYSLVGRERAPSGLPVQRDCVRPRRVDAEDHPLHPPLHGTAPRPPEQSLAVVMPATLPHCDQRLQFRELNEAFTSGHGYASTMMVAQRAVLRVYTAYPATSSPPAPGVE